MPHFAPWDAWAHIRPALERRQEGKAEQAPGVVVVESASSAPDLSGRWLKDKRASRMDAFKRQLDLLGLGGVAKTAAVKLISGISIEQDAQGMRTSFKVDRVPFFRTTEQYTFGKDLEMPRRDNREGTQVVNLSKREDGLLVDMRLHGPLEGRIVERYRLVDADTLNVESLTRVGSQEQDGLQVYHRVK